MTKLTLVTRKLGSVVLLLALTLTYSNLVKAQEENETSQMSLAFDVFPFGSRGLSFEAEHELKVTKSSTLVFALRGSWVNSEVLAFSYHSSPYDPYVYIDQFLKLAGGSEIVEEFLFTAGAGIKLHLNDALEDGFYFKPVLTIGYAHLKVDHKAPKIVVTNNGVIVPDFIVPLNDKDFLAEEQSFALVPEAMVGYHLEFRNNWFVAIEGGVKYRFFTNGRFVEIAPRLTGYEPSLGFYSGYHW